MKGDSIILVMFSALLGVLIAFGIAYLIERIREAQGESAEEYEENFVPARKRRSEKLSELRYAAAVLRDMKENTKDGAFVQVGAYWYEVQELTKSIEAIAGTVGNNIPLCFGVDTYNQCETGEKAKSLVGHSDTDGLPVICYRESSYGDYETGAGTLKASGGCLGGGSETLAVEKYKVRRLTPLECERLQGYPDGWTDIGEWRDERGKKHKSSDAARYKALGNSIALPPWKCILNNFFCSLAGIPIPVSFTSTFQLSLVSEA